MVKKITILFAGFFVILSIFVSKFCILSIKDCFYTYPKTENYQESVYSNGIVEEKFFQEFFLKSPVVVDKTYVKIGDMVNVGDKLAEIDLEATENLIKNSVKVSSFTDVISKIPPEILSEISKQYGIDINSAVSAFNMVNPPISNFLTHEVIPKTVIAGQSGIITDFNFHDKCLFNGNKPAFRISNIKDLTAELYVSEEEINKVKVGDNVILKSSSDEGATFYGTISFVYPVAEKQQFSLNHISNVKVIADINSQNHSLKPNFNVRGKINVGKEQEILTLPYDAIFEDEENREYVYVLKNNKAEKRFIKTGLELSEETEIKDGIKKDEVVLIGNKLKNGDYVNIKGEF